MTRPQPNDTFTETDETLWVGSVKWFDVARGFGFVSVEGIEGDVLLHANVLRNFGQSSIADGAEVQIHLQQTPRGFQAVEVFSISAPVTEQPDAVLPEFLQPAPEDTPYEAARIKWFDKAKGFGFANVFGSKDDVFIHADVLRRFGLADLQPGEAVCLRVIDGVRGKLAVEVRRWEYYEG